MNPVTSVGGPTGAVVAAVLYQRGILSLGEACRLADLPEAEFRNALRAAETLVDGTTTAALPTPRVTLPADFRLSVLMPVYNERKTIREILARVSAVDVPKEILVVDDGSSDGTREVLREEVEPSLPDVRVFYHERNRGKGAAVRTAIRHADGDVCVIQDADLEYDPREYFQLLAPILDGRADVVYGSRFVGGGPHRVHLFWHFLGNQFLTTLSNMFTNLNLTDMETGYKVIRTSLLQSLPLESDGFDIEPELTARLAKARARFYEVPISYSGRDYAEGKKIGWRDGVRALYCILRYSVRE
jgi:glycosyltransferase involved in cell wall biosynthesis